MCFEYLGQVKCYVILSGHLRRPVTVIAPCMRRKQTTHEIISYLDPSTITKPVNTIVMIIVHVDLCVVVVNISVKL